jgi:hypothetical protein
VRQSDQATKEAKTNREELETKGEEVQESE